MLERKRQLPSPALVISVIALVVAVGGSSFAIATAGSKSVKKIVNAQITKRAPTLSVAHATTANGAPPTGVAGGALTGTYPNPILQANAVNTVNIANNAVTNPKIGDNAVTSSKIGDKEVKAADLGDTTQIVSANVAIAANPGTATAIATCPAGTQVLSGGGGTSSIDVVGVETFQAGNGWLWFARNLGGEAHTIFATAVCLEA